ncbi:MAG: SH3 domain-containing protein, partial [Acidobacteriota bacterium]
PAWDPGQPAVQIPTEPKPDVERPPGEFRNPQSAIRNRRVRRFATFAILLIIFAGGLYGTSAFLRSRGILPAISNPFASKTGRANTDINLRPEPNASNDPIGLVTKDSRVRILKTQNNWHQVDVLEQGRDRDTALTTNRGWLNGKYVDLD